MALTDDIRTCSTPAEALLLLAAAIDELRAAPPAPADPWSQPLEWHGTSIVGRDTLKEEWASDTADAIAATKEALAQATDPDDIRALTARLKLQRDAAGQNVYDSKAGAGSKMGDRIDQGKRVKITSMDGKGDVEVFEVDRARQEARLLWAKKVKLWEHIPLTEAEAAATYAKGGPMWLYLGNRDACLAMPVEWRRELVEEIALDSTAEAQEVGRDLLMFRSESADPAITQHAIDNESASRGLR